MNHSKASNLNTNSNLNNFISDNCKIENRVVCLIAPTASGKTALAYELYDTGRYELISVDSALIYRDMNIGTAKPTSAELMHYPHHLVNIIDPTQSYSVAEFVNDVARLIDNCHQSGKIPLLVGGTMMYYMALLDGLSPVPDSDNKVRAQVEQWRRDEGIEVLYEHLGKVDATTHARFKPTDTQRITRAIEVYKQTGIAISEWQQQPKQALAHNPKQHWQVLAVMPDRPWLHQRIGQRLDIMWQEGLVDEVIGLLERYTLTPNMPSMRCVGYRQVLEYLVQINHPVFEQAHLDKQAFYSVFKPDQNGIIPAQNIDVKADDIVNGIVNESDKQLACTDMQNKTLYATRQLAKRQYTWLRKLTQLQSDATSNTYHIDIQVFNTMLEASAKLKANSTLADD